MAQKTFQRYNAKKEALHSLRSRYQPVYDNLFDDLIEKLNQIDFKRQ